MLLCMFSLFFIQPDLPYVLAFLCALILCSADLFLEENRTYAAGCLIFFAAAVFVRHYCIFIPQYVTDYSDGSFMCLLP